MEPLARSLLKHGANINLAETEVLVISVPDYNRHYWWSYFV